ncbi:MAG: hypothetical protein ACNYPE_02590 [Candidatus Azotimanducaceae bacterium WSBS_2022_MAG_OTU7]
MVYAEGGERETPDVPEQPICLWLQGRVTSADHPRVPSSYYSISKMRGEDHVMRLMEKP